MKRTIKIILVISFLLNTFYLFADNVFATTTATINDAEGVFIRSGPGTNNSKVIWLAYGTPITLVNTTKHSGAGCNGWYQVSYGGSTDRYICSEFVAVNASASINTSGYYTTSSWGTRVDEDYGIVRSYPGGSFIENIYLGTPVKILEKSYATAACPEGWTKISYYGNKTGYICDRLLSSYDQVTATDTEYNKVLQEKGFPESYWPFLTYLHNKYPNWIFVADFTNKDFNTAVASETGKNYIQTTQSSYVVDLNVRENPGWYAASSALTAFMLDPRNYLTEDNMFAFETLSYDSANHTKEIVKSILSGSYLAEDVYVDYLMNAASSYNISPVHLATRIKQEGGTNASYAAISGTATTVAGLNYGGNNLDGFYNYFNIGAWQDDITSSAVTRGIATAACLIDCNYYKTNYGAPWDTREKAIMWGAKYLSDGYIANGQDTLYYQKFNTSNYAFFAPYTHQFQTNIISPLSESLSTYRSLAASGLLNQQITFKIPVYNNMPTAYTSHPIIGDTNNNLASLKVNNESVVGFDSDVIDYTVSVAHDAASVKIDATPAVNVATVAGAGTINLTDKETIIKVVVTSQTAQEKTYTLKIVKQDAPIITEPITTPEDIANAMNIKFSKGYMTSIAIGTTATALINEAKSKEPTASVIIKTADNIEKTNSPLATGDTITITLNNQSKSYVISIKGDINGDGKINTLDSGRTLRHILSYATLTDVYLDAADANYDGKINTLDSGRILRHILGYATLI